MTVNRFARQLALFGDEGQRRIAEARCAIVGVGGLGTHVAQQLALLGTERLALIDDEDVSETNGNRYIGLRHDDPIPGLRKVDLGQRIVHEIDPSIKVQKLPESFISSAGFQVIHDADFVFGCLDLEGARLVLNELCTAYARSYIDLATDIIPGAEVEYGGRVCVSMNGDGCIQCLDVLDTAEAGADLAGDVERRNREAIYGVNRGLLGRTGPSVVSINCIIASLAVTEFMVAVTKLRQPKRLLTYKGTSGKVLLSVDQPPNDCLYCKGRWGLGERADVERYLRDGTAEKFRRARAD